VAVADRQFTEPGLARLYDLFCAWDRRDDFGFYLPMVMAADSVLDVGCGTGMLLHRARENGHAGRLAGLDPAAAMLEVARSRADIEWLQGDLSALTECRRGVRGVVPSGWQASFELIVMTGHAFQVLTRDAEIRAGLAAIKAALKGNGIFAFETRNPRARGWERWTPANPVEVTGPGGRTWRMTHELDGPPAGELVSFTTTYSGPGLAGLQQSHSTLRFLDADSLAEFLPAAGLTVERQYGDWDGSPLTGTSPEIITIARLADC
jgi:SAM-dependent methyltransferase